MIVLLRINRKDDLHLCFDHL